MKFLKIYQLYYWAWESQLISSECRKTCFGTERPRENEEEGHAVWAINWAFSRLSNVSQSVVCGPSAMFGVFVKVSFWALLWIY